MGCFLLSNSLTLFCQTGRFWECFFRSSNNPKFVLRYCQSIGTKECVAHRLFKSVQELEKTLDKLLNQGGLQIKWKRKIKNKGNAVIAS